MDARTGGQDSGAPAQPLFGARAVARGFATEAQVLAALRAQYRLRVELGRHMFLGEIMLIQGSLAARQVAELLGEVAETHDEPDDTRSGRFFGDVAIEMGYCRPEHVLEALDIQREEARRGERHRLIGEILFAHRRITGAQVDEVIARMHARAKAR